MLRFTRASSGHTPFSPAYGASSSAMATLRMSGTEWMTCHLPGKDRRSRQSEETQEQQQLVGVRSCLLSEEAQRKGSSKWLAFDHGSLGYQPSGR